MVYNVIIFKLSQLWGVFINFSTFSGDGSHGQLGHGTFVQEVATPKCIELLIDQKIVEISCGESHTAVVSGKNF